jgi:hypothetical protein
MMEVKTYTCGLFSRDQAKIAAFGNFDPRAPVTVSP